MDDLTCLLETVLPLSTYGRGVYLDTGFRFSRLLFKHSGEEIFALRIGSIYEHQFCELFSCNPMSFKSVVNFQLKKL